MYRIDHRNPLQGGVPHGPCGIEDIKMFQAVLPGYQLNVVSKEHLNSMIYSGHHANNYDVITSMPAFLARK